MIDLKTCVIRVTLAIGAAAALAALTLSPTLVAAQQAASTDRVDVLIGFRSTPGPADDALVRGAGGVVRYRFQLVPAIAANLPAAALAGLQRNPRVTVIEPDGVVFAISEYDSVWGVSRIGSAAVHDAGVLGTGVKVAVIDSGIACAHVDLAGQCAGGWDFVNNDNDPADDNSHGTHVAGTIGAIRGNGGVVGVSPAARLYAYKVLNASGSGNWSHIIAALERAVTDGVAVTNNSYGSSGDPGTLVRDAFTASAAAGILHVAAAGNSGNCGGKSDSVGYPARYDSVIAVSATNVNDARPCFSSTGPAVELAAPGVAINSTVPGGGYDEFSGTSMASPHVAGVAALLFSAGANGASEVRQVLRDTAQDLGAGGRDTHYGFGLVDAVAAVAALGPGTPPSPAVNVALVTDKSTYIDDVDISAVLTATVTNELGNPISPIGSANFKTTLNGTEIAATFAETSSGSGIYQASIDLTSAGPGSYTVTVEVTDGGLTGQDSAPFTISAAASGTVHVASVTYSTYAGRTNDKHLLITVRLVDGNGAAVGGAGIGVSISQNGSPIGSASGTTGTNGDVTFEIKNQSAASCYRTTVTSVSAAGLTWDTLTPANGSAGCGT